MGNFNYKLNVSSNIFLHKLSKEKKTVIYRVLQESLHNIVKYSKASEVSVSIKNHNDKLFFEIKDNGEGFDFNENHNGIGFKNMTSRVKKIKGEIDINSKKSIGTTIKITL